MQINKWEPNTDQSISLILQSAKQSITLPSFPLPQNVKLSDITPTNLAFQKELFFQSKHTINPIFNYHLTFNQSKLTIHTQHEQQALRILKMRGDNPKQIKQYLSKQQLNIIFEQYVEKLGIKSEVKLEFDSNAVSRTKVRHFSDYSVMIMRDPPTYTKQIINGVLDHEIGTHIVRKLNDRKQKYYKFKKANNVSKCRIETEEGLASLNQLLDCEEPLLFIAPLRYVSAILASKHSFVEVFGELLKYLADENQAWNQTVRVKRSLTNTEQKGGFYKDQAYFVGALDILKSRKQIDFVKFHGGKVNVQDIDHINTEGTIKPLFLDEKYLEKLDRIAQFNGLE